MCGLVVTLSPDGAAAPVSAALDSIAHRGPDDSGIVEMENGLCVMGHRRLSILDLSSAGHQPMQSADGRYHVVFNGEIYGFAALRRDLQQRGFRFRTRSDTEVVLNAYLQWGDDFVDHIDGMFAIAIWDASVHRLKLFRDRPVSSHCIIFTMAGTSPLRLN